MALLALLLAAAALIALRGTVVRLRRAEEALAEVAGRLAALESRRSEPGVRAPAAVLVEAAPPAEASFAPLAAEPVEPRPPESAPAPAARGRAFDFEELFGRRLPVWGGGAALALAGFFLVRYSIEIGLVTPPVRVLLGVLFGGALLGAAEAAKRSPRVSVDPRVAQALAGAGVAAHYGAAYTATSWYGLIGPGTGFAAMALVTALALGLAGRHGAPTAVLGLVGGFLTPALVGGAERNVPVLLGYLLLTVAGLVAVGRAQRWRWLGPLGLLGGFGWAGLLLADAALRGGELPATGLFLVTLGLGGLLALRDEGSGAGTEYRWTRSLPLFPAAAAFAQLAALTAKGGFGLLQWGLYGVLAAAVTALALREERFRQLPFGALLVALVTLALWPNPAPGAAALVGGGLLLVFAAPGLLLAPRAPLWAAQAGLALAGPFMLAALKLPGALAPSRWALLGLLLALAAAVRGATIRCAGAAYALLVLAAAALADAAVALGSRSPDWLPAGFALVALGVAEAMRGRPPLRAGLPLSGAMAAAVAPTAPALGWLLLGTFGALAGDPVLGTEVTDARGTFFQLALPGALLAAAAWRGWPALGPTGRRLAAVAAAALVAGAAFCWWKGAWGISTDEQWVRRGFAERVVLTALLFAGGAALARAAGRDARLLAAGRALLAIAVARFVLFDLGLFNPAWRPQAVGGPPLVNLLAPAYLLPAAALALAAAAERGRAARLADAWKGLAVAGVISWPLLAVRQLFHGSILPDGGLPTAENLAYSAAGLLTALALLGWGTARRDPVTRVASLVLMLATVAKVFLADASALDGLARIASFLGLGVSLIGISWFYTRHVFGRGRAAPAPAATPLT